MTGIHFPVVGGQEFKHNHSDRDFGLLCLGFMFVFLVGFLSSGFI